MYKEGLKKTKVATKAISLMISAVPGCGWGLSAVSLASSYGGYSALEKAVHKAYYKKKGIKVYYKIHKSCCWLRERSKRMKKKLRLKTFRKNIIQLVIFLGIVTVLSSSQKYIPYTRQEIIVQDIFLFLLYLVLSIVIDIINEKKQG